MKSFAEFEAAFLGVLQQERSDLQDLQGKAEAQVSAWIEHLFREYLGYIYKDFSREESTPIGAKGSKQLFPDLRINVLDSGLIFFECKRLGRLSGPKGNEELDDGVTQLTSYIRAHVDQATLKGNPLKTVIGLVTDGNRWLLVGLNRKNNFHTIAEWAFLTDDPRLIAQRLWLLAKPALAQPTSALVEFLARRTLAEVLKDNTKWLTKKVNEKLPDGSVSEELIGKWLRDALSDPTSPPRLVPPDSSSPPGPDLPQPPPPTSGDPVKVQPNPPGETSHSKRHRLRRKFWDGLISRCKVKATRHAKLSPTEYNWIAAGTGVRGVPFVYLIAQDKGRVGLHIERGTGKAAENKRIFDGLEKNREDIERAFGAKLLWERLEGKQGCRIAYITRGGYKSEESEWPEIQDAMIEAMVRLDKALFPHLAALKKQV
jgi:hypothetical protein